MFGFGSFSHLLVILVLGLILIGPKQLPEVARTLGRLLTELRRASNLLTNEFRSQMREEEKHYQSSTPPAAPMQAREFSPHQPDTLVTPVDAKMEKPDHPEEKKS
jgi:sec-independent protein translocase protein TatB